MMKCCHVIFVCIVSVLLVSGCDKHDDAQIGRLSDDAVVVAFGDSITYGTGAGRKESYPAVLEKLSGYEVINSGISGELSEDGLFRLGFVLDRYEPDLLILCHGGNDMLQKGMFDVGFVSGAQIDRYGNTNITAIGDYRRPKVRLVGSLAQTELLAFPHKPLCVVDLNKRIFVEEVDFITGVGYLHGGESRTEAGLKPLRDYTIITDKGVFGFHSETKEMTLLSLHPGATIEDVQANMSFAPRIAEDLKETEPPTIEQVRLIREVIDPNQILLLE